MTDIYIATHKQISFDLPPIYKWVQVNAAKNGPWEGYLHDSDGGDNISHKNDSYCELTALYRLWKHSNAEIQGLCHYRRFLGRISSISLKELGDNYYFRKEQIAPHVIQEEEIIKYLERADILLARNLFPYPFTAFEDLQRFVYLKDIMAMMTVIKDEYPDYIDSLKGVLSSTNLCYCNIFIARKKFTDDYCSWLFPLLSKIEKKIDITQYDKNHRRIFGYLTEVLLNVYIRKNNLRYNTLDIVQLDECTNDLSLKRRIWLLFEKFRLMIGLFPLSFNNEINKPRYKRLKNNKELMLIPPFTINKLRNYYTSFGGQEAIKAQCKNGIEIIYMHFFSFSLISYIVSEKSQLADIYREVKEFRERPVSFGKANIARVYCLFNPTEEEYICAMKYGVSLFATLS